jgi:hypothetical protein
MNKKEEDIHIKILKWAKENPFFTWDELIESFPEYKDYLLREHTLKQDPVFEKANTGNDAKKYILSFEGRFKLLEYEELNEARKSARNAMWIAIASILITLAAFGTSIYFTIYFTESVNVENAVKVIETNNT